MSALALSEVIRVAAFRSALRQFLRESERIAGLHGLTPQRYLLLLMIKGAADGSAHSTVTDLARRLQLTQHSVTELVDRAVKAGLVKRTTSRRDRRIVHLGLTAEGNRRLVASFRALEVERQTLERAMRDAPKPGRHGELDRSTMLVKRARFWPGLNSKGGVLGDV